MPKSMEYYLSKGFDPKAAAYFAAGRRRVTEVTPNDDLTLTLRFDNNEVRILDVKPLMGPGSVLAPFSRPEDFARVYLDAQGAVCWDLDPTIDSEKVWSNKADICPDACYLDSTPV